MDRIIQEIDNTFSCPNAKDNGRCRNEFQDNKYGKGKRVFTPKISSNHPGNKCCTVCGHIGK